ncbi:unnamed protein product [Mytilus edulis]|uniref:Reverse transcriptase n=1 Tax=Mytilus edulis TaxID=6550 RepID=A0A8S3Q3X3_MYTED|nr:unnamed protein product [Mytilus edulis]
MPPRDGKSEVNRMLDKGIIEPSSSPWASNIVLVMKKNGSPSLLSTMERGQTARWLKELGTYNLTVTHRAGRKHSNADALSRRPCKSCERQESGNHASDDETDEIQLEETDFVNQELHENEEPTPRIEIVRVCTRSQTGNQYSATAMWLLH